jgi:hypothetical protein
MARILPLLLILALVSACGSKKVLPLSRTDTDRTETFKRWLEGNFSNARTAAEAERLDIRVTRLPDFGHAFYVEELAPANPDQPLRQYVWMARKVEDRYIAEHWRLLDAPQRVGAWQSPEALLAFTMYTLRHSPECDIAFRWENGLFIGDSASRECGAVPVVPPGVVRTSTSMVLGPEGFALRLIGYDARGRRIFGPSSGTAWPWASLADAWQFERQDY